MPDFLTRVQHPPQSLPQPPTPTRSPTPIPKVLLSSHAPIQSSANTAPLLPADPAVRRALVALLLVYLVLWPLVAVVAHHSPPLDMIEGFVWSLHPQAGYYKHPPLPAWVIAASVGLLGKQSLALLWLGPLSIVAALAALWWLARQFLDERLSVVALFLTATQLYFNVLIPEFNHNVVQIPLWAVSIALFWLATRRGHWGLFIALGVTLGLCLLAKYSAALLYLFMIVWLLIDRESRRYLTAGRVFVCAAIALAVATPHLLWLVQHDFQPLHYAQERMSEPLSVTGRIRDAVQFVAAQLGINVVMLVLAFWFGRRAASASPASASPASASSTIAATQEAPAPTPAASFVPTRFLLASMLLPLLASLLVPLVGGRPLRDMWAMMMFTTLGLALVSWRPAAFVRLFSAGWLLAWCLLQAVLMAGYAGQVYVKTQIRPSLSRANFPGPELAALIEADWREKTGNAPLRYLVGSTWAAGNVAFFANATPDVMINGDPRLSPWVAPERLAACGYVLLWAQDKAAREPGPWMTAMNPGQPEASTEISPAAQPRLRVPVRWVIVLPGGRCDS